MDTKSKVIKLLKKAESTDSKIYLSEANSLWPYFSTSFDLPVRKSKATINKFNTRNITFRLMVNSMLFYKIYKLELDVDSHYKESEIISKEDYKYLKQEAYNAVDRQKALKTAEALKTLTSLLS